MWRQIKKNKTNVVDIIWHTHSGYIKKGDSEDFFKIKLMRFNHVFGVFPRKLKKDTLMQSIKEKCVDALNYKLLPYMIVATIWIN